MGGVPIGLRQSMATLSPNPGSTDAARRDTAMRSRSTLLLAVLLGAAVVLVSTPAADAAVNPTQYVNPFIGTDDSNSPNPVPGGAGGSTFPGAEVPFGMVQFSPDTPTASPSGYRD